MAVGFGQQHVYWISQVELSEQGLDDLLNNKLDLMILHWCERGGWSLMHIGSPLMSTPETESYHPPAGFQCPIVPIGHATSMLLAISAPRPRPDWGCRLHGPAGVLRSGS